MITMADMILSVAQDSIRDDIQQFRMLVKSGAPPSRLREIWYGILALIEDEKELYPPELHPEIFFRKRTRFTRRGTRPMIKVYLYKVHRFLDAMDNPNLQR